MAGFKTTEHGKGRGRPQPGRISERELRRWMFGQVDLHNDDVLFGKHEKQALPYHDGQVVKNEPRAERARHTREHLLTGKEARFESLTLRIRTKDEEPDFRLLEEISGREGFRITTTLGPNYPCISVKIVHSPYGSRYYEVETNFVAPKKASEAMRALDKVGKALLEAKEIAQGLADKGTRKLATELASA